MTRSYRMLERRERELLRQLEMRRDEVAALHAVIERERKRAKHFKEKWRAAVEDAEAPEAPPFKWRYCRLCNLEYGPWMLGQSCPEDGGEIR